MLCAICVMVLRTRINQLKIQEPLTLFPPPIQYVMWKGACIYSKLQPRVRVTESLFFDKYFRSECPVSVQVSSCNSWAKCGWYEGNCVCVGSLFSIKIWSFLPSWKSHTTFLPQFSHIKGAGGVSICPIMEMGFIVFFERGEWDLPTAFYRIKKYWS